MRKWHWEDIKSNAFGCLCLLALFGVPISMIVGGYYWKQYSEEKEKTDLENARQARIAAGEAEKQAKIEAEIEEAIRTESAEKLSKEASKLYYARVDEFLRRDPRLKDLPTADRKEFDRRLEEFSKKHEWFFGKDKPTNTFELQRVDLREYHWLHEMASRYQDQLEKDAAPKMDAVPQLEKTQLQITFSGMNSSQVYYRVELVGSEEKDPAHDKDVVDLCNAGGEKLRGGVYIPISGKTNAWFLAHFRVSLSKERRLGGGRLTFALPTAPSLSGHVLVAEVNSKRARVVFFDPLSEKPTTESALAKATVALAQKAGVTQAKPIAWEKVSDNTWDLVLAD